MMVRTAALRGGVHIGKAVWLVTMMPSRSHADQVDGTGPLGRAVDGAADDLWSAEVVADPLFPLAHLRAPVDRVVDDGDRPGRQDAVQASPLPTGSHSVGRDTVQGPVQVAGEQRSGQKSRAGDANHSRGLCRQVTNVVYVGKIRYKDEIHEGEQQAIMDPDVFDQVQTILRRNGRSGAREVRNQHKALLRGLLRCVACDCGMSHSYTARGSRQYRYDVCHRAQKRGWQSCPSPSLPAGETERFVIDQIRAIGRDPAVIRETLVQARRQAEERNERLSAERAGLWARLRDDHAELVQLAASARPGDPRLADAHDRIRDAERRSTEITEELATMDAERIDEAEVASALADFDSVWDCLAPREQARIIDLLALRTAPGTTNLVEPSRVARLGKPAVCRICCSGYFRSQETMA